MEEKMLPIGSLMIEHRLIERVIKLLQKEFDTIRLSDIVNSEFLEDAVDFMKSYAGLCHHGKEENILFYELSKKPFSSEDKKIMDELISDHVIGRENVKKLADAKDSYFHGNKKALSEILYPMEVLLTLYPKHIEKEDKHFFLPSMKYFTADEKDEMLKKFFEFDKNLIHERYKSLVRKYENITI